MRDDLCPLAEKVGHPGSVSEESSEESIESPSPARSGSTKLLPMSDTEASADPPVPADLGDADEAHRIRALPCLIALAAAGLAGLLGPADWRAGEARLRIETGAGEKVESEVLLGETDPFEMPLAAGRLRGEVTAPDGFPLDETIHLSVSSDEPISRRDLRVSLVMPDGAVELLPVTAASENELVAARTPPRRSKVVASLLAFVVVLWVTEALPLHLTSLLVPTVAVPAGVADAESALGPFFHPIIVLFFAGFLMAEAMRRARLDRALAAVVVSKVATSPLRLFAALIALSAFMSMWMSNTAAVAVLLPVAMVATEQVADIGFRRATVLGIAYAATVGGIGSAIGTPANQLAIQFAESTANETITFLEWFGFGLPMVVSFLPLMGFYLWKRTGARPAAADFARVELDVARAGGRAALDAHGLQVAAVFVLVAAGWLTQHWHGVHPGIVALAGALSLMAIGRIETADLGRISWPTLLTFGGGLTLGQLVVTSGTADWVVTRLSPVSQMHPRLALTLVAAGALVLTAFASNTAAAAALIPLAIPLANVVGVDPVAAAVTVAVATSIDFALVIGTPPTMLAHSTGLLDARDIFRLGAPLDLVGLLLLTTVVAGFWDLAGLV